LTLTSTTSASELVAIQVGRIITLRGEEIEGGSILIRDGKIEAVGKDVVVPWNATVYKYPRGVAMPGLIDCHSTMSLRAPNENVPNVPYISVLDGIDPSHESLKTALRDGITAVHVIPANATRIGGQGAVVRTTGRTVAEMVITAPSAMKISLDPPPGETRMENMAALRRTFLDLFLHVQDLISQAAPAAALSGRPQVEASLSSLVEARPAWSEIAWDKVPAEKIDAQRAPMVDLVRSKLAAFIYCPAATDVFKAFEIIDANNLKATLVLGPDAWKLADVLKARKGLGPVVLDSQLAVWETDPDTGAEVRHLTPRVLFDAGIRFALQPDGSRYSNVSSPFSREGPQHLWYQAALLVRSGIPRDEALRAVTLTPARILGLDHRMGSIEKGKDANIAIFSGEPLDARSWVELLLIEGKEAYRREKDKELELLLKDPEKVF
jgi:imidazolonepropionase-like amidohydrolase